MDHPDHDHGSEPINLADHPTAQKLADVCREFFAEVQDLTPGKELEARLNAEYGPGTRLYEDMCKYVRQGLEEGWVAIGRLDGERYRRGKICAPSAENRFFSITTVYMNSEEVYSGQYHAYAPSPIVSSQWDHELTGRHRHPYGEINCVVQIDKTAELKGMQGWQGAGWTAPGPGTHHFPQARHGALVALFFLPAGRIAYNKKPGGPQPLCV